MSDGREEREEQERRREWERQEQAAAERTSRRAEDWLPDADWQSERRDS